MSENKIKCPLCLNGIIKGATGAFFYCNICGRTFDLEFKLDPTNPFDGIMGKKNKGNKNIIKGL